MKRTTKIKLVFAAIAFCFFSAIFSDWDNFKSGLTGDVPVGECDQPDINDI